MNKNTIRKILNEVSQGTLGGFSGRGVTLTTVGDGSPIADNAAFVSDSGGYGVTDNAQFRPGPNLNGDFVANPWAFRTAEGAIMREMEYKWNMFNHKAPSYNDDWRAMVKPIQRTAKDLPQGPIESAFTDLGFTGEDIKYLKYLLMAYINARP
jgi:hypothetical protein